METKFQIVKPDLTDIPVIVELMSEQEALHFKMDPEWFVAPSPVISGKISKEMEKIIRYGKPRILVAKVRGNLTGFIIFSVIKDNYHNSVNSSYGEIHEIYLNGKQRKLGIGRALIQAAEEYFKLKKITQVMIRCSSFNTEAKDFYEHLGYRMTTLTLSRKI